MPLTLYKFDASPPVRAVQMVIAAIKVPNVKQVEVNLLKDHPKKEFVKINPQHSVPTLVDGGFVIWDSHAIATYLIALYATDDSLYPEDPKKRALIDQRMNFDSGILFPAMRRAIDPVFFGGEKDLPLEGLQNLERAYELTDKFLTSSPWLAGDEMSVADICCVATISTLNEVLAINKRVYPNLAAWLKKCSELEIYKKVNIPGLLNFTHLLRSVLP